MMLFDFVTWLKIKTKRKNLGCAIVSHGNMFLLHLDIKDNIVVQAQLEEEVQRHIEAEKRGMFQPTSPELRFKKE